MIKRLTSWIEHNQKIEKIIPPSDRRARQQETIKKKPITWEGFSEILQEEVEKLKKATN